MLVSDPCTSPNLARPARLGQPSRSLRWSYPDDQLRTLVTDAMEQLPLEQRVVIYRSYYQRWTTAEIANDLKITEAAVKSRLHDGLHAFRLTLRRGVGA